MEDSTRSRRRLTREEEKGLAGEPIDWKVWWKALGKQHRDVREFLGLSQEQIARLAGVSQGAVSRLEGGRGVGTPLVVILKVGLVLRRALRGIDPSLLNESLREYLALEQWTSPPIGDTGFDALPLPANPELGELMRLYRDVPDRQRRTFLSVVRAVANALSRGGNEEKG